MIQRDREVTVLPKLNVDSDSSAVERNTLYVVPVDLV